MNPAAVDLEACAREPIHLLGGLQPFGVLLAAEEPALTLRVVSANAAELLGEAPRALLGQPLAAHVPLEPLRPLFARADPELAGTVPLTVGGRRLDAALHRADGLALLELMSPEAEGQGPAAVPALQGLLAGLSRARGTLALLQAAADSVRTLTGFDRVMVYRFDADWHGEVVAESLAPGVAGFLGLHFPASDIPAQARALYVKNRVRLIADAQAAPVPLVPAQLPHLGRPLDLGSAALRSVSAVHLEYLRNLGVRASFSVSLVREGALWGMLACHHLGPRWLPLPVRSACDVLGQMLSLQLAVEERAGLEQDRARRAALQGRLVEALSHAPSLEAPLAAPAARDLLAVADASGAVLALGERPLTAGDTPPPDALAALCAWLDAHAPHEEVWHTDRLPSLYPAAGAWGGAACGLLAVRLGAEGGRWALWLRPEVARTVTWAGNPDKPAEPEAGALHPRASFSAWRQTVRGTARPWTEADREAARALKGALVGVVLRHADALGRLGRALQRSNEELDAFSATVSHDLKEPLRGIQQYVQFLREDAGETLARDARAHLEGLTWLAGRSQSLLDDLFEYSRVGRVELAVEACDLQHQLDDVLATLGARLQENRVTVRVPRRLPTVRCDRVRVREVFANLVSNAAKYQREGASERWVEVGWAARGEPLPGRAPPPDDPYVFWVRDPGIGIPRRFHEAIFQMFRRLHPAHAYGGGSGAGLAIARRIVERHGGRIWVESEPEQGSTFLFTLGPEAR